MIIAVIILAAILGDVVRERLWSLLHPYVVGGEAGPADNDEEDGDYSGDGEDDEKVGDEDDDDVDSDDRCTHISWVVLIWGLRITLWHSAVHYEGRFNNNNMRNFETKKNIKILKTK